MTQSRPLILAATMALAMGCTKAGRSLVLVDLDPPDPTVAVLASVDIKVMDAAGTATLSHHKFTAPSWQATNTFGVYVPSSVNGTVMISAQGLDAQNAPIAMSLQTKSASVTAGQTTQPHVLLHLVPISANPGTGGAGGGAAGSGGKAATGGMGGGAVGGVGATSSGGSGAGTGGVQGSGGIGGNGGTMAATGGAGGGGAAGNSGRAWQGAMLAENNDLMDDYTPAVAVDSKGNAVVAYTHGSFLWANYYDAAKGTWGTEGSIDSSPNSNASWSSVAVDKDGHWLVVYLQDTGVWQSTSSDGKTWSAPAAISTATTLSVPVMAMNQDGVAVAVWTQNIQPDNHFTLTGSARVNGIWTAPQVLKAATAQEDDPNPSVAVTSTGTGIVAWEQTDASGNYLSVWQGHFSAGAWTPAVLVETYDGGNSYSAGVAANNAGQSVITWVQTTTTTTELWAERFPATGAPEAPVKVTEGYDITSSPSPSVTLDESGAATVAWAFYIKTKYDAYTARAAWGQAWSPPMAMETDDDATDDRLMDFEWVIAPSVGHDAAGNVVLAWRKRMGARFDMWARVYDATAAAWGPATLLETRDANTVYAPVLAVGPSGVAVASWTYAYEHDIWANVYR